jgi:hypothetical protein
MGEKNQHQPIKQPVDHCTTRDLQAPISEQYSTIVHDLKETRRYSLSFEQTWQVMGFMQEDEELDLEY